jgi:translocation protein SEC66
LRKRLADLQAQKESEKEWWETKKKSIEADLLAELDEPSTVGESVGKKAPSRTSDDDTVLVESGGPVDVKGQQQSGGGKKKKGKK